MKKLICRAQRLMLNNKGFSLTELLVAVVVLGIIVVPMLHTFVTGANTAAKSSKLGDATLAAQNISETIEANDLAEVLKNGSTLFGPTSAVNTDGGKYILSLSGINTGLSTFDAEITFDPAAAEFNDINAQRLSDYPKPDAVYAQGLEEDPDAMAEIEFNADRPSMTAATPVKREITLTLRYDEKKNISAVLVYDYSCTYSTKSYDNNGVLSEQNGLPWSYSVKYDMFPQGFVVNDDVMPNIYVMYYPWYAEADNITIDNTENIPLSIFLVKQRSPQYTDTEYQTKETSYNARIVLLQKFEMGPGEGLANVYSNAKQGPDGQTITAVKYVRKYLNSAGIVARFAGANVIGADPNVPSQELDKAEADLVSKSAKSRFFKVDIKVFPKDDNTHCLTQLATSKLQILS